MSVNAGPKTHRLDAFVLKNVAYENLPEEIRKKVSETDWGRHVVSYSIKRQLRWRSCIVCVVEENEEKYYARMLRFCQENLMMYPYHLAYEFHKLMRMSPFVYYRKMIYSLLVKERSFDHLPNFAAADCVRLLGIGRNEFINLMNNSKENAQSFLGFGKTREEYVDEMLLKQPSAIPVEHWWLVHAVENVTASVLKKLTQDEQGLMFRLLTEPAVSCSVDKSTVLGLYNKGLVYVEVPIYDDDRIDVPPLEGFVMNRVSGHYLESLLYKIMVTVDSRTSVAELAEVLGEPLPHVKTAVSAYCRLGFAHKIGEFDIAPEVRIHESWPDLLSRLARDAVAERKPRLLRPLSTTTNSSGRIGLVMDASQTAQLMMGNFSSELTHLTVTLFEAGKLVDENIDGFLRLIEKVESEISGDTNSMALFAYAVALRRIIGQLRHNSVIGQGEGLALDLLQLENLFTLDSDARRRLLERSYTFLVYMAPMPHNAPVLALPDSSVPIMGPPHVIVGSLWFSIYLGCALGACAPPLLLVKKGDVLAELPEPLQDCDELRISNRQSEPFIARQHRALKEINQMASTADVLVEPHNVPTEVETAYIPFPIGSEYAPAHYLIVTSTDREEKKDVRCDPSILRHPLVTQLSKKFDLVHNCGYITMQRLPPGASYDWTFEPESVRDNSAFDTLQPLLEASEDSKIISMAPSPVPGGDRSSGNETDALRSIASEENESTSDASVEPASTESALSSTLASNPVVEVTPSVRPARSSTVSSIKSGDSSRHRFKPNKTLGYDWQVTDLHMGLAAFDAKLSLLALFAAQEHQLFAVDSLERMRQSNVKLVEDLHAFVASITKTPPSADSMEIPPISSTVFVHNGEITLL